MSDGRCRHELKRDAVVSANREAVETPYDVSHVVRISSIDRPDVPPLLRANLMILCMHNLMVVVVVKSLQRMLRWTCIATGPKQSHDIHKRIEEERGGRGIFHTLMATCRRAGSNVSSARMITAKEPRPIFLMYRYREPNRGTVQNELCRIAR